MTWNLESKCCKIIFSEETRDPIQITLNYGNYTHFFDNGNVCVGKKRGWQNPTSFIWQCVSDGADSVSGWHGLTLCWMMTLPSCAQPRHQHRLISFKSTSVSLAFALCANKFCTLIRHSKTKAPDLVYVHMVQGTGASCAGICIDGAVVGGVAVLAECDVLWPCKELWQMTRYITSPVQPSPAHASPQLRGDQRQPTTRALDWIFNNDNKLV